LKAIEAKDKRTKKKKREQLKKLQRRVELGILNPNDIFDVPSDQSLFALEGIQNASALDHILGSTEQKQADGISLTEMPDPDVLPDTSDSDQGTLIICFISFNSFA
jgi:hypothetical protein